MSSACAALLVAMIAASGCNAWSIYERSLAGLTTYRLYEHTIGDDGPEATWRVEALTVTTDARSGATVVHVRARLADGVLWELVSGPEPRSGPASAAAAPFPAMPHPCIVLRPPDLFVGERILKVDGRGFTQGPLTEEEATGAVIVDLHEGGPTGQVCFQVPPPGGRNLTETGLLAFDYGKQVEMVAFDVPARAVPSAKSAAGRVLDMAGFAIAAPITVAVDAVLLPPAFLILYACGVRFPWALR